MPAPWNAKRVRARELDFAAINYILPHVRMPSYIHDRMQLSFCADDQHDRHACAGRMYTIRYAMLKKLYERVCVSCVCCKEGVHHRRDLPA